MKRFKEFLLEAKWNNYLYHATEGDFDPKDIKPNQHFGTLHAAMARGRFFADQHAWNYDKDPGRRLKVHVFKYNNPGKGLSATEKDINDPSTKNKFLDAAKDQGYSHVKYTNKVEDPESTSTVVFDPKNLQHVHTFEHPKFASRSYIDTKGKRTISPFYSQKKI